MFRSRDSWDTERTTFPAKQLQKYEKEILTGFSEYVSHLVKTHWCHLGTGLEKKDLGQDKYTCYIPTVTFLLVQMRFLSEAFAWDALRMRLEP